MTQTFFHLGRGHFNPMQILGLILSLGLFLGMITTPLQAQNSPELIFAVITEEPKDKGRVQAQVLANGKVNDGILMPKGTTQHNPMWKKLEMCQGVKAQAMKTSSGYEILEFRILGASMLPMPLQGVAGDCFLKKAFNFSP